MPLDTLSVLAKPLAGDPLSNLVKNEPCKAVWQLEKPQYPIEEGGGG